MTDAGRGLMAVGIRQDGFTADRVKGRLLLVLTPLSLAIMRMGERGREEKSFRFRNR